ncbi:hypothetical protein PY365_32725 [Roseiarcaceae bacterium H3SJ34-1]|uniref:hypothetical protein n=1 Tax=Terripilifer ovatus TaxID=3032367 RepID=UPI003AB97AC8|nr:hypothetical protein [Roseiarcaceae bacterium H3SJ34-1]
MRDLTFEEQQLWAAFSSYRSDLERLGYTVMGTYRIALSLYSERTMFRLRYSDKRSSYIVDSDTSRKFGEHRFEKAEDAVAFLANAADKSARKRQTPLRFHSRSFMASGDLE